MGATGAKSLAGVFGGCPALAHLDLSSNQIGTQVGKLVPVGGLTSCQVLTHLALIDNGIDMEGVRGLAEVTV
eukprot:2232641-Rhodomonas_salina.3